MIKNYIKNLTISIITVFVIILFFYFIKQIFPNENMDTAVNVSAVNSFNDCVAEGNMVMESYPRQCRSSDGRLFVEDIGNFLAKLDLIQLNYPAPNQVISSPLEIRGEARGFWYFEADFPVLLLDSQGNMVAQGIATAQDEWMTEEFVPFLAELSFPDSLSGQEGRLILQKDNPSGLAENDDSLTLPIIFE